MTIKPASKDWKFATATCLSLLSVIVPIALWRADINPKSLGLNLLSSFEIISSTPGTQQALRVLYQGVEVKQPYSTIVELTNSGSKPIQASDIDGQIEIRVSGPANLLRSQVISRIPESLEPQVRTNKKSIEIAPLLLNPNDRILLEILTSGGKPRFAPRARIAGVQDVKIQESYRTPFPNSRRWFWLLAIFASINAAYISRFGSQFVRHGISSGPIYWLALISTASTTGMSLAWILGFVYSITNIYALAFLGLTGLLAGQAMLHGAYLLFPPTKKFTDSKSPVITEDPTSNP